MIMNMEALGFLKTHIKYVFLKVTGGNKEFAETLIDSFIHSSRKYLFSVYCVPGTMLAVLGTEIHRKISTLHGKYIPVCGYRYKNM